MCICFKNTICPQVSLVWDTVCAHNIRARQYWCSESYILCAMSKHTKFRNKNGAMFSSSLCFTVCCLLWFLYLLKICRKSWSSPDPENYCFELVNCFSESPRQGKLLLEKCMHNLHNSLILASRFTPESQKSEIKQWCGGTANLHLYQWCGGKEVGNKV